MLRLNVRIAPPGISRLHRRRRAQVNEIEIKTVYCQAKGTLSVS